MRRNYTAVNSTLIYTTTALLTLIIHESGHFIVERLWGFKAVMHPDYGSYSGNATDFQKIVIAAAGPLTSLLQGSICLLLSRLIIPKNIFSLLFLWLALHGFILFSGYMVCSPFFIYGDTGQVFYLLHFPLYVIVAVALLFVFILIKILGRFAPYFNSYGKGINNNASRLKQLIFYPLIAGGILSILLQLPVPNFLLLFAGITTPLMFLIVYAQLKNYKEYDSSVNLDKLSAPVAVLFLLTIFVVRLLV